jgi:hypothetical protein
MAAPVATAKPSGAVSHPAAPVRARTSLRRTRIRRAVYSLVAVAIVLVAGTIGFHGVAGLGWVDAFYFESMLATGQGPPLTLTTDSAKIFASLMAFISVGSVLTSIVFTLGPIAARVWRDWSERMELEVRKVEDEIRGPHPPPEGGAGESDRRL